MKIVNTIQNKGRVTTELQHEDIIITINHDLQQIPQVQEIKFSMIELIKGKDKFFSSSASAIKILRNLDLSPKQNKVEIIKNINQSDINESGLWLSHYSFLNGYAKRLFVQVLKIEIRQD